MAEQSPWRVVLSLVGHFEEALAMMWLFEHAKAEVLANGRSVGEIMDEEPSERGVAEILAMRMRDIEGGVWRYVDFYSPSRGNAEPTLDEVHAFVAKCAERGVTFTYSDGRPIP